MSCTDILSEHIPLLERSGCRAGGVARSMPAALECNCRDSIRDLFPSPEVFLLAKTGEFADVSAAVPTALAEWGVDVYLVMPGYTEALYFADRKQTSVPLRGLCRSRLLPDLHFSAPAVEAQANPNA